MSPDTFRKFKGTDKASDVFGADAVTTTCYSCGVTLPYASYRMVNGDLLTCCDDCRKKPEPEGPVERWKTAGQIKP